ncbi:hypothetical protein [Kitasatospora sp. NPDC093102]|uniref:hypothetical protein n=1 Tax=Kitasatospora sp. NPDC093102 TaxID=3155069 RepID=UPI0034386770
MLFFGGAFAVIFPFLGSGVEFPVSAVYGAGFGAAVGALVDVFWAVVKPLARRRPAARRGAARRGAARRGAARRGAARRGAARRKILLNNPWQVWPCRAESMLGQASKRCCSWPRTEASLRHSGASSRTWNAMTDGHGIVWIVGDLRFPGMAASPDGVMWWDTTPIRIDRAGGGLSATVQAGLTRSAVGFLFDQ